MKEELQNQIKAKLSYLYGKPTAEKIYPRLIKIIEKYETDIPPQKETAENEYWNQHDALLITYGDSLKSQNHSALYELNSFMNQHVKDKISFIHLLPFFPYTSDDGFAVTDFRAVNPELGDWDDIHRLSENYKLVFDAVINHVSESSVYMEEYRKGNPEFENFFIELDKDTDTSSVLRTRNLPLLHEYETSEGKKWLWTTFSRDQLDLNFKNPKVLLEIVDVLLFFLKHGASMVRLDAIPYLWKELGTSCAHLPQTHEIIKLIRNIYDLVAPQSLILTETNVPHKENISYFGNQGDEAQMIYNFSLPPLIFFAISQGNSKILSEWAKGIEKISDKATYLNITATHDGIGVRPTEGILTDSERQKLLDQAVKHHGAVSGKTNSDGSISPYELNINYFDALNDPDSEEDIEIQISRFMLSQAIPLSFIGIPGIYIHSLLGSRNWLKGVEKTSMPRSINREKLDLKKLETALNDPNSVRYKVFSKYLKLLELRAEQAEFHPNSPQEILDLSPEFFALKRTCEETGSAICVIHNLCGKSQLLTLPAKENCMLLDLVSGDKFNSKQEIPFEPYQFRWFKKVD